MKHLSIVIPVYNVEKYIYKCIESIFCQNIDEDIFEVIIVNDGTKDKSMELISCFIKRHSNIIVIEQDNQGLSVARNKGLSKAQGEYILFIDSDDLLIKGMLKPLLDCAMRTSVDMVIGGFLKLSDEQIDFFVTDNNLSIAAKPIVLSGEEAFVNILNPKECYIWRTIYRREFLFGHCIKFMPGIYFEDIPFTTECYVKAERCVFMSEKFYIYRQRTNSIVSSVNKKKISDFNIIIEYLWNLVDRLSLSKNERKKIRNIIFSTFSIEMWYLTTEKELFCYRRELVKDLKKRVPDLFFANGFKQIIISCLFRYVPNTYLWLRSVI